MWVKAFPHWWYLKLMNYRWVSLNISNESVHWSVWSDAGGDSRLLADGFADDVHTADLEVTACLKEL